MKLPIRKGAMCCVYLSSKKLDMLTGIVSADRFDRSLPHLLLIPYTNPVTGCYINARFIKY
jgi:uncharacterized protein YcgL (UPF0745 family)